MSEYTARQGASTRRAGLFSVSAENLASCARLLRERIWIPHRRLLLRLIFIGMVAGAVLGPLLVFAGLRWERALRAEEAAEKPWRLEERARRGELGELAAATVLQGKVAPLHSRALRYLDAPPALTGDAARIDRTHWAYAGPGTAREKPVHEYRVVVLGDSFSGGDPSFSHFLDRLLGERVAKPWTARVINLSLEGYNTLDAYGMLRHVALDLDPDLVIYAHYQNDFEGGTWEDLQFRQRFEPCFEHCTGPSLPAELRFGLQRRSALYKELLRRAKVAKYQHVLPLTERAMQLPVLGWMIEKWARWYNPLLYPEADLPIDYRYHRLVMEQMIELTAGRDIDFAILRITPFPHYGTAAVVAEEERVFADLLGAHPVLAFSTARDHLESRIAELELPREALYLDPLPPGIDTHPSAIAHYLMAEMFLREQLLGQHGLAVPLDDAHSKLELADRASLVALLPAEVVRGLELDGRRPG